jgi:3-oxoacyl-[acyl-carrier protein] reductase
MGVLDGKAALVTGGSRGIGAAIVRRLAADGAVVTFTYTSSEAAAAEVVAGVKTAGGEAIAVQADQAELSGIDGLFDQAAEPTGTLDIFVCNAAQAMVKPIADVTVDDYDQMFATNVKGPYFAIQRAGRVLPDGGRIIALGRMGEPAEVADVVGFLAGPDARWMTGQNLLATGGMLV